MAKKQEVKKTEPIFIPGPNIVSLGVKVVGTAPMITHPRKIEKLEESRRKPDDGTPKKKSKKTAVEQEKEYQEAFHQSYYEYAPKKYGFPAAGMAKAVIAAAGLVEGITMATAKCMIRVYGFEHPNYLPLYQNNGSKKKVSCPPQFRKDWVMVGPWSNRQPDIRIRSQFNNWWSEFRVEFDADYITKEAILNLIARAGWQIGECEMRPQKGPAIETCGTFEIMNASNGKGRRKK